MCVRNREREREREQTKVSKKVERERERDSENEIVQDGKRERESEKNRVREWGCVRMGVCWEERKRDLVNERVCVRKRESVRDREKERLKIKMIQHTTIFQVQQLEAKQEQIWLAEMADSAANESFWTPTQQSQRLESRNFAELKPAQEEQPAQTEKNEVTYRTLT